MKDTTIEAILTFSSTIGLAALILYGLTVDRLVMILHDEYSEHWTRLGRPVGILYIPKGVNWWQGIGSLLALVCDSLLKTPRWLATSLSFSYASLVSALRSVACWQVDPL